MQAADKADEERALQLPPGAGIKPAIRTRLSPLANTTPRRQPLGKRDRSRSQELMSCLVEKI